MAKSKAKRSRPRKGVQKDPGQKRGPVRHPHGYGLKGGGYDVVKWVPNTAGGGPPSTAPTGFTAVPKKAGSSTGQALHRKYYNDAIGHIYHLAGYGGNLGKRWDAANPGVGRPVRRRDLGPSV